MNEMHFLNKFTFSFVACVASVYVRFGAKNYRAINGAIKRWGGGGEEGRKRLQTNPWILKTAHTHTEMSCCHKLTD